MPERKVLFIVIDQLRADCITGALAAHVATPNIDALRAEAVTFANHFSVTNPCGPSRASLLTGLYAMNHRSVRNGTPLSAGITNIALEMRKSGYDPLLFGYTDTSHDPRTGHPNDPRLASYEGVLPGFREIVEMCLEQSFPWRAWLKAKGYELPDYSRFYEPVSPDPGRAARPDDPAFYKAEDSDTAFLTTRFIEEMAVRTDQRWFTLLTYIRPHPPLVAPEPYNRMYRGADLPLPDRLPSPADEEAMHPFVRAHRQRPPMEACVKGCDGQIDSRRDEDVQMLRAIYLGLITEVDHHVGRVIRFLKDSGQYDDTLIVLTADHGEMLGDHHMWGKQHVFDPSYRVPLIIRDPHQPQGFGQTVDALTESTDLMPTILDHVGRNAPHMLDGRALTPFLRGETPADWRDAVMMELDFGEPDMPTALQTLQDIPLNAANLAILHERRWKLVHFGADLPPLLFDLESDPHEMKNLAEDPAYAGELLRMTRKLLSHRMRHADRTLSTMKVQAGGVYGYFPD